MGALEAMPQENQVVDFKQHSADFFLRHKALLDELTVPHEQRGAVSLFDLKLERNATVCSIWSKSVKSC